MNQYIFDRVSKSFGSVSALQEVSFSIPEASIFGLLGPNGAGKTTLIRIITNILGADQGHISYKEQAIQQFGYEFLGYMPEEKGLYRKMKVGEHLIYLGRLKGLRKVDAKQKAKYWLHRLQAEDWWDKKIQDLSKGMQQKVQFIATVLHDPKLLILDEPFSGLDPVNADLIKDEICQLQEKGTTILFSTHRMEQVEEMCDSIVLINKGEVMLEGRLMDIKNRFRENIFALETIADTLPEAPQLYRIVESKGRQTIIQIVETTGTNEVLRFLIEKEIPITGFQEILPSLHDIFIKQVQSLQYA